MDRKFAYEKRKILLFVDNCPAHPKSVQAKLKNIKLAFFPPNMTSSLQPMDQGIIHNLKQHYRKRILKKILDCSEESVTLLSISLLDAIRELSKSWVHDVKAQTISNCFKKAGFAKASDMELNSSDDDSNIPLAAVSHDLAEGNISLEELWSKCTVDGTDVNLNDFINVDNDVLTIDYPTDEDILQSVIGNQFGVEDSDEEDQDYEEIEHIVKLPSFLETRSPLEVIHTFVESRSDVPETIFETINLLEDFLDKEKVKATKQTKINNFFQKNI